jgi:hypothetical protein
MQLFEPNALPESSSTEDIKLAGPPLEFADAAREAPPSSIWDITTPLDGFDLLARAEFNTLF